MSAAVAVACGSDTAVAPGADGSPAGSYTLQTIHGKPTPATVYADTFYLIVVSSGNIVVGGDGSYRTTTVTQESVLNHLSTYYDSTRGSWVHGPGGTLVFTDYDDQSTATATLGNGILTLLEGTGSDTMTVVYKKD